MHLSKRNGISGAPPTRHFHSRCRLGVALWHRRGTAHCIMYDASATVIRGRPLRPGVFVWANCDNTSFAYCTVPVPVLTGYRTGTLYCSGTSGIFLQAHSTAQYKAAPVVCRKGTVDKYPRTTYKYGNHVNICA